MTIERDPSRLIEPETGVPDSLRRALGAARDVAPTPDQIAALAARLPLPAGPGGGQSGGGGQFSGGGQFGGGGQSGARRRVTAPATIATSPALTGALAGAILGLVAGGAFWSLSSAPPSAALFTQPSSLPLETPVLPPAATATPRVPPPGTPVSPASSAAPAAPPSAAASASATVVGTASPGTEAELLQRARSKARSEPAAALALVSEHASRFPRGALAQEREVIAITALVAAGRRAEAEARAERFFSAYPGSSHLRRVDTLFDRSGNDDAGKNSKPLPPPTP